MSTINSEPVERTTGRGTADRPALAQSVRFVYGLDEPGPRAEALTSPGPVSAGTCLSLAKTISYDSAANLVAVRAGEAAEDEADAATSRSCC